MSTDNGDDSSIIERVYDESKVDSNTAAKTPRDGELKKSSEEGTNVDGNDGCSGMDISIDEVNDTNAVEDLQRLQLLPLPKIPGKSKSLILEQMELLTDRYDCRRLKRKEDVKNKTDCYTHSCKHCGECLSLSWKPNKKGGGNYITSIAQRHLEKNCNDDGKKSIKSFLTLSSKRSTEKESERIEALKKYHLHQAENDLKRTSKKARVAAPQSQQILLDTIS